MLSKNERCRQEAVGLYKLGRMRYIYSVRKPIRRLVAHYCAPSIYDIDPDFYATLGVKVIFADLDRTLESLPLAKPSARAFALRDELRERGLTLILLTRKRGKTQTSYAHTLQTPIIERVRGARGSKIRRYLEQNEIGSEEACLIGSSIVHGSRLAFRQGFLMILTDPLAAPGTAGRRRGRERKLYRRADREETLGQPAPLRNTNTEVI